MRRENLDFGEALKLLAAQAGVDLQPRGETGLGRRQTPGTAAGNRYRGGDNLPLPADPRRRGADRPRHPGAPRLTRETWEGWQLGYALDSWDALKDRLTAKGYTPEELEAAGLVIRREDGSGYYDRFRGR